MSNLFAADANLSFKNRVGPHEVLDDDAATAAAETDENRVQGVKAGLAVMKAATGEIGTAKADDASAGKKMPLGVWHFNGTCKAVIDVPDGGAPSYLRHVVLSDNVNVEEAMRLHDEVAMDLFGCNALLNFPPEVACTRKPLPVPEMWKYLGTPCISADLPGDSLQ